MTSPQKACKQPVIAVVGHIDHGKTTLLDYIRKSSTAEREIGGITQKVSAYEVEHTSAEGTRAITFIDTPGHEAFQKMRARGAKAADIAVLVVAADDGVKPQTIEAHNAIKDAGIPYIVAFTKIDKDTANLERAKESVMKQEIYLEGLGGDVPYIGVSGKSGVGVSELLDLILLVSDLHSISCDPQKSVLATVIESTRDPRNGNSATVIVKEGTLALGGFAVSQGAIAPLRSLENYLGKKVQEISCGKPARITGFSSEPLVGSSLVVCVSKNDAEKLANQKSVTPTRLRNVTEDGAGGHVIVRVSLKSDSAGSLEALEHEIGKLTAERVDVLIVQRSVGSVTENDVKPLIGFEHSYILGFNVKVESSAKDLADRQHISLEERKIIYELTDWFKKEMEKHVPKSDNDAVTGDITILKHFSTSGSKHIVGGRVTKGSLGLGDRVLIIRRGIDVGSGKVTNLQMQKSDVSNVPEGMEFGSQIDTKADIVAGDQLLATHKK